MQHGEEGWACCSEFVCSGKRAIGAVAKLCYTGYLHVSFRINTTDTGTWKCTFRDLHLLYLHVTYQHSNSKGYLINWYTGMEHQFVFRWLTGKALTRLQLNFWVRKRWIPQPFINCGSWAEYPKVSGSQNWADDKKMEHYQDSKT